MLSEEPPRTLVLSRKEISAAMTGPGDSPVRIVPAWASPPDTHLLIMLGETAPKAAAALRVIRHRLEQKRSDGMWVFGVTSSRDGEGKSTFATQLSLVLSESQRARVLLLEANFQRPTLAKTLGFRTPEGHGFSTQLARKMRGSMDPWCITALGPALHVLAEETGGPSFPETLHSTHFQNVVGFLGRGYDYVIVDGPSILGSGDANVMENAVDGVIVVARSAVSKGAELRESVKQLGPRKTVGVVLWDHVPAKKKNAA